MNWKERVAEDPNGGIERSAARRGLSKEELRARRAAIAAALGGDEASAHLSLNELHLFRSSPEQLSQTQRDHLDNCEYCKILDDAISPEAIKGRTTATTASTTVWEPEPVMMSESDAVPSNANSLLKVGVAAAALPLVAVGLMFKLGTFQLASDQNNDFAELINIDIVESTNNELTAEIPSLATSDDFQGIMQAINQAFCDQSGFKVRQINEDTVELARFRRASADLPTHCQPNGSEASFQKLIGTITVGQELMVMTPPDSGVANVSEWAKQQVAD